MHYLASPYSHESEKVRQFRYEANIQALADLLSVGLKVFSPIVHNHPAKTTGRPPQTWQFWMDLDFEIMKHCEAMVVLCIDGWAESAGVKSELRFAHEHGIRTSYMNPLASNALLQLFDRFDMDVHGIDLPEMGQAGLQIHIHDFDHEEVWIKATTTSEKTCKKCRKSFLGMGFSIPCLEPTIGD